MKKLTVTLFFSLIGLVISAQTASKSDDRNTNSKVKKTLKHTNYAGKKSSQPSSTTSRKTYRAKYVAVSNNNKYPQTITVGEQGTSTIDTNTGEKKIIYTNSDGTQTALTKKECELKIADIKSRIEKTKSDKIADQHAITTGWYEKSNQELIQLENILKNY